MDLDPIGDPELFGHAGSGSLRTGKSVLFLLRVFLQMEFVIDYIHVSLENV